jgi:hypothetical protein
MSIPVKFTLCLLFICCSAALSLPAFGQGGGRIEGGEAVTEPYTPERGSPERKAIVDALRRPVEKQLRQQVMFKINHLKVHKGWAFLLGVPQRPDGSAIEYRGTPYQDAIESGAFDDGIVALLHRVSGKWKVVQYVIGATDVPYVEWDKKYRAPKEIMKVDY